MGAEVESTQIDPRRRVKGARVSSYRGAHYAMYVHVQWRISQTATSYAAFLLDWRSPSDGTSSLAKRPSQKKKQRAGDVEGGPPRDLEESVTPQCRHAAARHAQVGMASAPFIY